MAAATHINDAGTWRQLRNVYVNDNGTWRLVKFIWVNDAGTWRQVFAGFRLDAATYTPGITTSPDDAVSSFWILSPNDVFHPTAVGVGLSGTGSNTAQEQYLWGPQGLNAADYEVRADLIAGSVTAGTTDAWGPLTLNYRWEVRRTSNVPGVTSATLRVSIRQASDGVVVAGPVDIVLQAQVTL